MSPWKPSFKLAGKVFTILRKRPDTDGKEISRLKANNLAVHDIPRTLTGPLPLSSTSISTSTLRHDDRQSNTSSSFGMGTSSTDDSADVHQSGSLFAGAKNFILNGGEFYNVGGNLTIQRTDPREIAEIVMDIHAKTIDRRLEEMMGHSKLPRTISVGLIYIMDATGRQHELTMNMARSFDQFNKALRILFELGSPQDRLLVKYTNIGAYDLTIDDGGEQRQLTNQEEWSNVVQRGTTIVMRVVMVQHIDEKKFKCPLCAFWNWQEEDYGQSSIDCRSCKQRFQVTWCDLNAIGTNHAVETVLAVPDHERDLISNYHLKYTCDIVFLPMKEGETLREIMQQQISSPDYAFLIAGQTSIGDEKVSDEAVHLAAATLGAGHRGVWKNRDMSRISMSPIDRFDETTSGDTSCDVDGSEFPHLDHTHTEESRKEFYV